MSLFYAHESKGGGGACGFKTNGSVPVVTEPFLFI